MSYRLQNLRTARVLLYDALDQIILAQSQERTAQTTGAEEYVRKALGNIEGEVKIMEVIERRGTI